MDRGSKGPRRPIDIRRESAGSITIGSLDEGPVSGFVKVGDRLLVVKAKAVYEVLLADQLDPGRTNPQIPDSQQKVLGIGDEDPMLGRSLLTAQALFRPDVLPATVDCGAAMQFALDAARDLAAMYEDYARLENEVDASTASVLQAQLRPDFSIPTVVDLDVRAKAFLQRAHRVVKALLDICRQFYGPQVKHADSLLKTVEAKHGGEDEYLKLFRDVTPFLRFIWNARNSAEHPHLAQRLVVKNFTLSPEGQIVLPSIEVIHSETPQPPISAVAFFWQAAEQLAVVFELMIASVCGRHAEFGKFPVGVTELPENMRQHKNVRFGYIVQIGENWGRLG